MRREFLERLGIRTNAAVGLVVGVSLSSVWFYYGSYRVRGSLPYPIYLYGSLAVVSCAVVALFVTMVLTLGRWFVMGIRG